MLEKEPRSFTDVSALVQTMELERFHAITNRRVERARMHIIAKVYEELNSNHKHKLLIDKSSFKMKYLKKLQLYDLEDLDEDEEVKQVKELACDAKWPVCMFDHTRKFCQPTFFVFKTKHSFEMQDNYFTKGNKALTANKKEEEKTDNNKLESVYDSLLVERSSHYCTNKEFADRINYVLKQDKDVEDIIQNACDNVMISDEKEYIGFMDKYVKETVSCNMQGAEK